MDTEDTFADSDTVYHKLSPRAVGANPPVSSSIPLGRCEEFMKHISSQLLEAALEIQGFIEQKQRGKCCPIKQHGKPKNVNIPLFLHTAVFAP